jgi:transposase InsO family protein
LLRGRATLEDDHGGRRKIALFEYINGFYNARRRHSALGGKSPVAFESKVA